MTNVKNSTNVTESQQSICDWAEGIFGPVADPRALVTRAMMEMKELDEAVADRDLSEIGREAADVMILLYRLVDQFGLDLDREVQAKMAINRARKWSAKGDGTGSHI
ncbi:nucleotide pyrophosphohydrolase [Thalassospira sp. MCCC 1A03138]|uniref:nucleotide pyrophosphohydrolase n=1 Tax=Thalassospira sp. MCCC 1A03138 TaxID=1470576 RepID=UPI001AF02023|nr:nucleotide pyrophosphohydrolase [Thalassospira sp. MCCC 1A03138]